MQRVMCHDLLKASQNKKP